jgi:hypothetical protein
MPLSFPTNPSASQTYQSGSSATYTWNGTFWQTSLPPTQTVLSATTAATAISASVAITSTSASFATSASLADKTKLWYTFATSTASYTLPSGYSQDQCRYTTIGTEINTTGWFNTSTYRFTPQKAGYWQIHAGYDIYRGTGYDTYFRIRKNTQQAANNGGYEIVSANASTIVYLNGTTDYVDATNSGGATAARTQGTASSIFHALWVGE